MHQITSSQFKAAIELDPAWASKLTRPVEITDHCDMQESKITHLSPLLHFTGKDENGNSANFTNCSSLKIAEGTFAGFVDFQRSGIEKIRDLSCGKNNRGGSATFGYCHSLKVAEGNFPGMADFSRSDMEKIGDLTCGKNEDGNSAYFNECGSLKVAKGKFSGAADFADSSIETIGDLCCGTNEDGIRLNVQGCHNLKSIPFIFNPKEIRADWELTKNLTKTRAFIQKKRSEIVEIII